MILLHYVDNPFQPIISRKTQEVAYVDGQTLGDLLRAAGIATARHVCVVDGFVVPEEMLEGFTVKPGAAVVVMPAVGGGSFMKVFAEVAVMVAAAAITYGASLTMFGVTAMWTGLNVSASAASMIAGGIALGGNLLINAFMGPHASGGPDSASFDPTGPRTVASGGTPIAKGYGTYMSAGVIIGSYVTAEGQSNYLNVLTSHGFGPAESISDVRINNSSAQNYIGATYQVRNGSNDQTPVPYFNNIVNGYPQNVRVIANGVTDISGIVGVPVIIPGTGTATQGLQVVVQFPQGVFYSNSDGSLRSLSIAYKVEYAVSGSGNWQVPTIPNPNDTHDLITYTVDGTVENYPGWVVVPTDGNFSSGVVYDHDNNKDPNAYTPGQPWSGTQTVTYYNPDGSSYSGSITLNGEWQPCDPNLNQQIVYSWLGGWVIFSDTNQGTLYHQTNIFNLPPAKYDVRITKYGSAFSGDPIQMREGDNNRTGDQIWVHSINEVQYQDLAYPNMILVGVRALATDQISGANINITAQVEYGVGTELPAALAGYQSNNPAVVSYDMLVNPLYGGAVPANLIDVPAFVAWADYCAQGVSDGFGGTIPRAVFNGIFDQAGTSLWKQLQKVASLGYAMLVQIGQIYTVVVEQPVSVPAQVFTAGNVLKDSLRDTWLSIDDRSNRIEATFADAARDYRTDEPCAVMLPSDIQAGVEQKPTRVQLLGCTSRAQAWHWCYRKLLATSLLKLTRSIDVGIEAVACQVGSIVGIQDDVTQWASGGRIQDGSTAAELIVDVDGLTFAPAEGWTLSIVHPVVVRGTGTIQSITGTLVQMVAPLPAGRIVSIESAAGVVGAVQAAGTNTLTIPNASAFAPGQVITFVDLDVIDTQPVASISGSTVVPMAPFTQAPMVDAPWVYGQSAGAFPAKLFTVQNIRRKGDFAFTIDTIEYNPAVLADDTPQITETIGTPDVDAAVANLKAVEQYVMANGANGGQGSCVALGWQLGPNTDATQIWVARNEPNQPLSNETLLATVRKDSTYVLYAPTGSILEIRAVGIDSRGVPAPFSTAPVVTITIQGAGQAPGDISTLNGATTASGTALAWTAATGAATYEVRYNNDPNNTDWQSAQLLWSGSATTWGESQVRTGVYLVKGVSAAPGSVESINAATYNYLQSSIRLNQVGFIPGQSLTVTVTENLYDSGSGTVTLQLTLPAQNIQRADGTFATTNDSAITWVGLQPGTSYIVYTYVDTATFNIHSGAGDANTPDTSANGASQAACSAAGHYPGPVINVTTTGSSGGGTLSSTPPTLTDEPPSSPKRYTAPS